eukprot:g30967.t1
MSGVQSSSKLLFILWNFNEENEHGFQVAIWRLALLEALRRSVSWLALVATYAGKLWIYKQVPQRSNAPSGPTHRWCHTRKAVVVNPVPWLSCPQHGEVCDAPMDPWRGRSTAETASARLRVQPVVGSPGERPPKPRIGELVPEPSLPGAVPEGQLPAKLERSNTGISKAGMAPPPRLERSNTGMSKASSNRTDSKKTRFLEEDPETISTETSAEATETSGRRVEENVQRSGPRSGGEEELRQESSESETASHGSDVPAEDPGQTVSPPQASPMIPLTGGVPPAERADGTPADLMKIALLQEYKADFLQRVKARRREPPGWMLRRDDSDGDDSEGSPATGILREVPFFREFDDVLQGTIYHLAKLAVLQDAQAGEVLFRQGDDPVDCYVVSRGAVGVYIRKEPQTSPRDFQEEHVTVTLVKKASRCQLPCFRRQEDKTGRRMGPGRTKEFLNDSRHYVTEGFNTISQDSDLGTKVVVLQRGAAFGELGLMERKPRAASIRCESKCTFLVIRRFDTGRFDIGGPPFSVTWVATKTFCRRSAFQKWFSESISADVYRKRMYFIAKIPGFSNETLRNNPKTVQSSTSGISNRSEPREGAKMEHAVDLFKEMECQEGQVLLKEGVIEDAAIYIVRAGHLDIIRQSRRPGSAGVSPGPQKLQRAHQRPLSAGRRGPFMPAREVNFGRFGVNAIFCSLSTLGLQFPEPWREGLGTRCRKGKEWVSIEEFTIRVSSKASLWVAQETDLAELPDRVLSPLKAHLRQALRPLLCYSGAYQCMDQLILEDTKDEDCLGETGDGNAPYCYATHVLPSTSGALGPSVWFLLLSEARRRASGVRQLGMQDVRNWLALNGWTGEEIQLMILVVIGALPLLLHPSFSWLRRQQVWGPWPLRDFACLLPSGTLLRSVAIFESRGQSRSHTFVAALLFSVLVDAARYAAIASSLMTVMGSRWNALKGCYLASSLIAMAAAMSPWLLQCITEKLGLVSLEDGDADLLELGRSTFWATAPLALLGYVFQASTVFFFEKEVLTFKGPGCWSDGSKAPGQSVFDGFGWLRCGNTCELPRRNWVNCRTRCELRELPSF